MPPSRQPRCRFLVVDVPRGTGFGRHRHDEHQLLAVDRGALAVRTDATEWAVPARSGVWLAASLDHELVAVADATVVFAYVEGRPTLDVPATGVVAIRPLLRETLTTLARPGASDGARRTRLEAVLIDELADLDPATMQVVLPADPAARQVADVLLADPADPRVLADLGREVGASARTLQRRFGVETGLTFQRWRRRARVQCAMGRLADGEPVSVVAHACGFASVSAFIAAFRAELGTTPARWRARLAD